MDARFPLKRVKDSPPVYKRNVSGSVSLLPGTKLRPVRFHKRQQNEEAFSRKIHGARMFPRFFCFEAVNYAYATLQEILDNENPSMRAVAKILRARASEHSSYFCEQFEQRPNFSSTFKFDGTIRYP